MQTYPLVSIIIPCFNQGRFLEDSLKAVFEQTYKNWECIIINDGSTDETEVISLSWCSKDTRFRYVYKQNSGVSNARNVGLSLCKGNYIQFLDADDLIKSNKLKFSVAQMVKTNGENLAVVISGFLMLNSQTKNLEQPFCHLHNKHFNFNSVLYYWEESFSIPIHCGFFNASFFSDFSFPDALVAKEDWIMWLSLFKKNPTVFFIEEPLAIYRRHSKNKTNDGDKIEEKIAAFKFLANILTYGEYSEFLLRKSSDYYRNILFYRGKIQEMRNSNIYVIPRFFERAKKKIRRCFTTFCF